MPFTKVASLRDVPPGTTKGVQLGELEVALYNVDGQIHATSDVCTHAYARLSEGTLIGEEIECPKHGGRFNVTTGAARRLPAFAPVKTFTVQVEGEDILLSTE